MLRGFFILITLVIGLRVSAADDLQRSVSAGKVAVLFESGFDGQSVWEQRLVEAKRFYSTRGFQVIVLSKQEGASGAPTAKELKEVLSNLRDVRELHLEFIGHGRLVNENQPLSSSDGSLDPIRFPSQSIPSYLRESASLFGESIRERSQFALISNVGKKTETSVGIGDLRSALAIVGKNNPKVKTTLYALNCYSGNLPLGLSDLPNVRVYSSTLPSSTAVSVRDENSGNPQDFPRLFQQELDKGKSYGQAFANSQKRFLELSKFSGDEFLHVPQRSSSQSLVTQWCEWNEDGNSCGERSKNSLGTIRTVVRATEFERRFRATDEALKAFEDFDKKGICSSRNHPQIRAELDALKKQLATANARASQVLRHAIESAARSEVEPAYRADLRERVDSLEQQIAEMKTRASVRTEPRPGEIMDMGVDLNSLQRDRDRFSKVLAEKMSDERFLELRSDALRFAPKDFTDDSKIEAFAAWTGRSAREFQEIVRAESKKCASINPAGANLTMAVSPAEFRRVLRSEEACANKIKDPLIRAHVLNTRLYWVSQASIEMMKPRCDLLEARIRELKLEKACYSRFVDGADSQTWNDLENQWRLDDEKLPR